MVESLTFAGYELIEQVGRGGMAEVFKAEKRLPDGSTQVVAIKRLFPRLAADREFVGMFVNEARIASSMEHPNVVRTYDLINAGSYYYIVMEYLAGMDLEDLISLAPPGQMALSLHEAAYVVHEVAMGLGYAHRGGADTESGPVVHRDISPGNILLDCNGRVLITDFGIARAAQYAQVTRPGILKGKYEYMAPEYVAGNEFDGRADLFSLGVVTYELMTGENPFADLMPKDIWDKVLNYDPPPPSSLAPEVPKAIDRVVAQALQKDPELRIQSGEVFGSMLRPFFSTSGSMPVPTVLGLRVNRVMHRPGECAENPQQVALFLPDDDEPGDDMTQEVHLDELLELVEPQDVPRPDFSIVTEEGSTSRTQDIRKPGSGLPRPLWIGMGLAGLSAVALLLLLIWPEPTGFLSVASDRRAEVYVDDQRLGLAPLKRIPLSVGKHTIEVRRPGSNRVKTYQRAILAEEHQELKVRWSRLARKKKKKPTKKTKKRKRVRKPRKKRR